VKAQTWKTCWKRNCCPAYYWTIARHRWCTHWRPQTWGRRPPPCVDLRIPCATWCSAAALKAVNRIEPKKWNNWSSPWSKTLPTMGFQRKDWQLCCTSWNCISARSAAITIPMGCSYCCRPWAPLPTTPTLSQYLTWSRWSKSCAKGLLTPTIFATWLVPCCSTTHTGWGWSWPL